MVCLSLFMEHSIAYISQCHEIKLQKHDRRLNKETKASEKNEMKASIVGFTAGDRRSQRVLLPLCGQQLRRSKKWLWPRHGQFEALRARAFGNLSDVTYVLIFFNERLNGKSFNLYCIINFNNFIISFFHVSISSRCPRVASFFIIHTWYKSWCSVAWFCFIQPQWQILRACIRLWQGAFDTALLDIKRTFLCLCVHLLFFTMKTRSLTETEVKS